MQGAPANTAHTTHDPSWQDQLRNHPYRGEPGYLQWRVNLTAVLVVGYFAIKFLFGRIWEKKTTDWATRGKP